MNMATINWLAVFVAALAMWVLGAIWYSPVLFVKPWIKACGFTEEDLKKKSNMGLMFGTSFLLGLIMAANLAMFLNDPKATAGFGAAAGAAAGIGWVALAISMNAMFERRSFTYILITGGYYSVSFILMGAILGAWR
jgi:hypothetical protein